MMEFQLFSFIYIYLSFLVIFFMDIDSGMVMKWCCVRCGEVNGLLSEPRTCPHHYFLTGTPFL